jgi:hypothetical protein
LLAGWLADSPVKSGVEGKKIYGEGRERLDFYGRGGAGSHRWLWGAADILSISPKLPIIIAILL